MYLTSEILRPSWRFFSAFFLVVVTAASAQTFTFTSCSGVTATVSITGDLTAQPTTTIGSDTIYSFSFTGTWSLTTGGSTQTTTGVGASAIDFSNPSTGATTAFDIGALGGWSVYLIGSGTLLTPGVFPTTLPPLSAWSNPALGPGSMLLDFLLLQDGTAVNLGCSGSSLGGAAPGQALGDPSSLPGDCGCGDPINIGIGNLFEQATDYRTAGANRLGFTRYYNSMASSTTFATSLGTNWRSNYDRYLRISPSSVVAERPDGQQVTFTSSNGGAWTTDTDIDLALTNSGSTWTLTDHQDMVETYTGSSASEAILQTIEARNGYMQRLQYNSSNQLTTVTDSFQRQLSFTYGNGLLKSVTTPDGLVLIYDYSAGKLTSVGYSTSPPTTLTYLYENTALPSALTGIVDENGNRYATWTYDSTGRALTSQHAGGAGLTTVVYNDTDGSRTVTGELGQQEMYKFTTLQGVPKVTEVDRLATANTGSAQSFYRYDSNGYTASLTDWNGNQTTYVNDVHGQPTTIDEAVGTAQARTTTIAYLSNYHLPSQIVAPELTTSFTYDSSGNPLTKTLTDTTTTVVTHLPARPIRTRPEITGIVDPYVTKGTTRTWTYTWANFLLASVKGPRTDVSALTSYTYDNTGALIKTTNALGQATQITQHLPGGLPQTIVDPNGVTTTLTYDERLRLLTSTVSTGAGPLTTTWSYDAAGNLVKTTLPDSSALTNTYDAAHRLTGITDLLGQSTNYTLDALGDRTQTKTANASAVVQLQHSRTFDALGRVLEDIGGVGQITSFTYDSNGNALTVTDPLSHATQEAYDALNRLISTIDAASGLTKTTYDAHDRPVTVEDPNNGLTTYVYDGFGDVIQRISPDTGKTVYYYDLAGNLTQRVNYGLAGGLTKRVNTIVATANYTYDALGRVLTATYPSDAAENVAYNYDQSGHGFGVGRLTSVTDAVGTLSRSYDERGNVLSERRAHGAVTLVTSTTYDAASRVAAIAYPSGWTVTYARDTMGRITAATATPAGGSAKSVASGVAYEAFGPVNALTYGNGVTETRSFDLDYRLLHLTDTGTAALQNLTYSYDAANNVSKITDGVTAGNTQTLGYDVLDRLINATGSYGTLGYTYTAIGNRLTQTSGGVTTNYTYASGSNQLASIETGATTQTVVTSAAGNVSSFSPAFGPVTNLTYNQSNRLATASAGASQLTQYTYDAFGQRIVKVGNFAAMTLFQYDQGGHLLEETDRQGNAQADYIYLNGRPVAEITPASGGKIYFLHDDRLGTPQLATDTTQAIAWVGNYQPFGALTASSQTALLGQDLRLPGQENDLETGLYHNGFRDYSPALARYIESDPIGIGGGLNTYGYAEDNPAKFTDFSGEAPLLADPLGWAKDKVWQKLSEEFYKGSLYAEGGFALPKDYFDWISDFSWNALTRSPSGIFLDIMKPTELNNGEDEWLRKREGGSCPVSSFGPTWTLNHPIS